MLRFTLTTIFGYLVLLTFVSAEIYYITPTPNITCPNVNVTCLTLTEYAQKTLETTYSLKISLIFAPGNHHLHSDLRVGNAMNLIIQVEHQNSSSYSVAKAIILCNSSGFTLEDISTISINNLEFNGCMENAVKSIDHFRLQDCRFHTGHGIELESVKTAIIKRSSFVSLRGRKKEDSRYLVTTISTEKVTAGGAIATRNSTLVINKCQFDGNTADNGGSMYSTGSNITLHMSNFSNNTADIYGGAISTNNGTYVTIQYSKFINNKAYSDTQNETDWLGGATAAFHSTVVIKGCQFDGNMAGSYGGSTYSRNSNIEITRSNFTNNIAYSLGGSTYSWNSEIKLNKSSFTNNTAYSLGGAIRAFSGTNFTIKDTTFINNMASYGGGVATLYSAVVINDCQFDGNIASKLGGSMHSRTSDVEIKMSNFTNNAADIFGGAISATNYANITIQHSTFINNRAEIGGGAVDSFHRTNMYLYDNVFTNNSAGRGGVIGTNRATVTVRNSLMSNSAAMLGGVIYALSSNVHSSNFSLIINNRAEIRGVIYAIGSSLHFSGNTSISDNYGSLYALSSNIIFKGYTKIASNAILGTNIQKEGTLSCFQSSISFEDTTIISQNQVYNSSGGAIMLIESEINAHGDATIVNNTALSGGGIYAYQSEINFQGRVNILRNNRATENGGGIHAISTSIKLSRGQLQFFENKAERGGGLCLELNSKLYLIKDERETCLEYNELVCINISDTTQLRIQFTNNSADYGGAVYVSDDTNSGACAANINQPTFGECYFQGLALHNIRRSSLHVRNILLTGNSATKLGGTIFGGLLDRCTVSPYAEVFNKYKNLSRYSLNARSYLMEVTDLTAISIQTEVSSEPVRVCICENSQPHCYHSPPPYKIKKGHTFQVSLVTVDQVNNPVPSKVRAFLLSHDGGLGEGQDIQSTKSNCTELTYTVSSPHDSEKMVLYADGPCGKIGISQTQINLEFLPCSCPVGFNVSTQELSNCICDCDSNIYPEYVTSCSFAIKSVRTRGNIWISYINISDQEGYLIHPHCPFDYCRLSSEQIWINLNVPNGADAQCAINRSGKLCGSCKDSLSLTLGSSHCMPCSNNWLALLIVFAIAGVVLVAFLLVCNLTVAVGTINGLIFYANILTTNRATFFPSETHNFITVFIAWLNLDFGFKTCFYDGMDGYAKEWLQLAFPFYIVFIVAMVIIVCEYSTRIARIFTKTHPVATLATLILLSYTKSLRVIIAALSSATLKYPDGSHEIVWLTDANIPYFKGKHIPLFLVALLILLIGIAYTLLLFFYQWLLRCSYNRALKWIGSARFYPFMDAYHASYGKKYRYWTGLLLFVRAFVYSGVALNVSGNPSINLLLIGCTMVALCLLKLLLPARVYKSWPLDILIWRSHLSLNLLVFSFFYIRETGGNQTSLAYTSTIECCLHHFPHYSTLSYICIHPSKETET